MLLLALFVLLPIAFSFNNGVAITPGMGWNSRDFGCNINEDFIKQIARALNSTFKSYNSLETAGYVYLTLDDCWQADSRDANNKLQADSSKFPSGIKKLAKYVHDLGLKFGLSSDVGNTTNSTKPGSWGNEELDAKTFEDWGVDYLNYANWQEQYDQYTQAGYTAMSKAILTQANPIYYAIGKWAAQQKDPSTWAANTANSWRIASNLNNTWDSILNNLETIAGYSYIGAPGAWSDLDLLQLQVDKTGLTYREYQTQFALWAILKSPLFIGYDITDLKTNYTKRTTKRIPMNPKLIKVNQDPLGIPATRLSNEDGLQIWGGPLQDNEYVALFLNTNDEKPGTAWANITAPLSLFGLAGKPWHVHSLIHQNNTNVTKALLSDSISVLVRPHGAAVYKFTPSIGPSPIMEESNQSGFLTLDRI